MMRDFRRGGGGGGVVLCIDKSMLSNGDWTKSGLGAKVGGTTHVDFSSINNSHSRFMSQRLINIQLEGYYFTKEIV